MNGARVSGKGGISIDFSDFNDKFFKLVKDKYPNWAGEGLFEAGNELLRDAIEINPQAPKKTGALWGSATVNKAKIEHGKIEVEAGFDIQYAAKLHELPLTKKVNWTTDKGADNPGPKFLELKMSMFKEKYMKLVGLIIKKRLG